MFLGILYCKPRGRVDLWTYYMFKFLRSDFSISLVFHFLHKYTLVQTPLLSYHFDFFQHLKHLRSAFSLLKKIVEIQGVISDLLLSKMSQDWQNAIVSPPSPPGPQGSVHPNTHPSDPPLVDSLNICQFPYHLIFKFCQKLLKKVKFSSTR